MELRSSGLIPGLLHQVVRSPRGHRVQRIEPWSSRRSPPGSDATRGSTTICGPSGTVYIIRALGRTLEQRMQPAELRRLHERAGRRRRGESAAGRVCSVFRLRIDVWNQRRNASAADLPFLRDVLRNPPMKCPRVGRRLADRARAAGATRRSILPTTADLRRIVHLRPRGDHGRRMRGLAGDELPGSPAPGRRLPGSAGRTLLRERQVRRPAPSSPPDC